MAMMKSILKKVREDSKQVGNPLYTSWGTTDIISSNCPDHIGVRLNRIDDETYQCPIDKKIFKPKGSVTKQTSKDNYYLGYQLK
jgi:hypothetical protein